jgi:hypothetical protein
MVARNDDRDAPGGSPGPAIDRTGAPVRDPSPNVFDLVEAAIQRQDDLRIADSQHIREMASIRAEYDRQLREADRHEAAVRSGFEEKLSAKETARLDAIRAVDVANVESARQVAEARATTLQTQQQASADALRNQVEQARITTADALESRVGPLLTALEDLRRTQYQQQGEKSSRVETTSDQRANRGNSTAMVMAIVMSVSMLISIISVIAFVLKK